MLSIHLRADDAAMPPLTDDRAVLARVLSGVTAVLAWAVAGLDLHYLLRTTSGAWIAPGFDTASAVDLALAAAVALTASYATIRQPRGVRSRIGCGCVYALVVGAATLYAGAGPGSGWIDADAPLLAMPASWVALLGAVTLAGTAIAGPRPTPERE